MSKLSFILDQHVDQTSVLWLRRDHAVSQPHFSLSDLSVLDAQIEANLDGLRVAEKSRSGAGWKVCERELRWGEPGEVFVAGVLAWENGAEQRMQQTIEVGTNTYENSRAFVSALAWLAPEQTRQGVWEFLKSPDSVLRRVAIAVQAVQRTNPGNCLAHMTEDTDCLVRARAIRAAGELGRVDLLNQLRIHLDDEDQRARIAAAWSMARLADDHEAVQMLCEEVQSSENQVERSVELLVRRLSICEAQKWLNGLIQSAFENSKLQDQGDAGVAETQLRLTVRAIGVLGIPDSIPWLLDLMDVAPLARVAGEAFTMITGLSLDSRPFEADWPEGFQAGPTEDPADDRVALDPDENLPWPHREVIAQWWVKHCDEFRSQTRYLLGRPIEEGWCEHVLRAGNQRQRAAAALELAIRRPSEPLFEVRAPGKRQLATLGL